MEEKDRKERKDTLEGRRGVGDLAARGILGVVAGVKVGRGVRW